MILKNKLIIIFSIVIAVLLLVFLLNEIDFLDQDENKNYDYSLLFCGDFMIGDAYYGPYDFPFENLSDIFENQDEIIINLESSITDYDQIEPINKSYLYKMDSDVIAELIKNNITICNLANNHILDYGQIGFNDTISNLSFNNIDYFGAGFNESDSREGLIKQYGKLRVSYLGYFQDRAIYENDYDFYSSSVKPGVARLNSTNLKSDIPRVKSKSDLVIISFHMGTNYVTEINELTQTYAQYAIDLGADAIIIHSPHIILPIELYKNKPIFYSLGNFIFTTPGRFSEVKDIYGNGLAVEFKIIDKNITNVLITPFKTNNQVINFQPYILDSTKAQEVFNLIIPANVNYRIQGSTANINLLN